MDNAGAIARKSADLVLPGGRPDKHITDSIKIKQVCLNDQPVL